MVGDNVQSYVSMAAGLTKATREKARAAAKGLLAQAGLDDVATDAGDRVSKLADEIIQASRANRELLRKLVAAEIDKAAGRLGFARAEDLDGLRGQLDALRVELADIRLGLAHKSVHPAPPPEPTPVGDPPLTVDPVLDASLDDPVLPPTSKAPAKKAPAVKKTVAKKAAAKKTAARPPARKPSPPRPAASS